MNIGTNDMEWQDLPERKNCFTVRNASMLDLDKQKIVRAYSANTRINVVQKTTLPYGTFYRTEYAKEHGLNWAFKASAFGLPNDVAPSAPSASPLSNSKSVAHTPKPAAKQKSENKTLPKGGEARQRRSWLGRLFRRKNG